MGEGTILITEHDGTYQLQNSGISEFALIGILECVLFDLKSASRQASTTGHQKSPAEQNEADSRADNRQPEKQSDSPPPLEEARETEGPPVTAVTDLTENLKVAAPEPVREVPQPSTAPDLRTRISNAVKAIRGLGARIEDTDLSNLTEEELQLELEELTSQYKRLKSSREKASNKLTPQ